jgi:carotenoid cleavage dioxygenase
MHGVLTIAEFNRQRMKRTGGAHPYLSGIHQPMSTELTLSNPPVSGKIPPELDGRYLRIGPNPIRPNPANHHWFLGEGMVHGVRLAGGKALWYRNRWIRSRSVSAALGEAPAPGPRNGAFDDVNTNVLGHAGAIWACVEGGGYPVRLNEELGTLAHDPFGGTLQHAFSAHPHRDPETGELHAIAYNGTRQNTVWHVVVDRSGCVRREEPIAVRHGPMIHDCMITRNFVIVLDLPCTFSMRALLAGHAFPYRWNPRHGARLGLLPREGRSADILWCEVDPCYVFHPANAFENDDGTLILDACVHDRMFAQTAEGPDSKRVEFERWTVDPAHRRVERAVVDPDAQEFPRIDERFVGRRYRHAVTMALPGDADFAGATQTRLFRHDLIGGTRQVHEFGAGRVPGEFVFVPRTESAAEGDGWLLGYVVDTREQTTDLVILDAQRFTDEPVARVHLPHRVPPGFHGNWVPAG